MAYYTREQTKSMLSGTAPQNREAVIKKMVEQGHQFEGLNAPAKTTSSVPASSQTPELLQKIADQKPIADALKGPLGDVGIGALKGAGESIMNIGKLGYQNVFQPALSALGLPMQSVEETENVYKSQIKPALEAKNWEEGIGKTGERLAEFLLPGGIIGKLASKAGKVATAAGLGEKASKLVGGVTGFTGDVLSATGINALQEGRAPTMGDVAGNALFAGGIKAGGKLIGGIGKGFLGQLLGATKNEKAVLEKKGIDIFKSLSKDVGVTLTKKGMAKKAGQAINKYIPDRTKILNQLDDAGIKVQPKELMARLSPNDIAKELDDIIGTTTFSGKLRVLKEIDTEIAHIKKVIGDKALTPSRIHKLKQLFDKPVNWDKLNPADKAAVAVNKVVADNARAILDRISKGKITEINAKIAPLATLQKLAKKGEYSKTLGDIIAGSSGLAGGGIKGALTGLALQRALRHPATQSLLGVTNYKLGSFLKSPLGRRFMLGVANKD